MKTIHPQLYYIFNKQKFGRCMFLFGAQINKLLYSVKNVTINCIEHPFYVLIQC
jgi:hypothetical protein